MIYSCAEAAKLLKSMNEELAVHRSRERKSIRFTASADEDIESARPVYHYREEQEKQNELLRKVRNVKHAINGFNQKTMIPEFGITIDEMLVYIPQLTEKKRKLTEMAAFLPKERVSGGLYGSRVVEYTYTNYSMEEVQEDLLKVTEELAKCQLALDRINNSETLDLVL